MGLFSKKPIERSSEVPLYSIGSQKTVLIVGLGNVGKEYDHTRHNIGFDVIDQFARANSEFSAWVLKKDLNCHLTTGNLGSNRVILIKPTTFMNESGRAVQAVQNFYKIDNSNTLVVHDELDVPFGQIRTKVGGGSAGNNGLKSIIAYCNEDFGRVRIGIDGQHRIKNNESDYVLKPFNKEEKGQIDNLNKEAMALITEYIHGGKLLVETRSFLI